MTTLVIPKEIRKAGVDWVMERVKGYSEEGGLRATACHDLMAGWEACYKFLTSQPADIAKGEPTGWIAYSERHGYDKTSFRAKESLVAEMMIKGYPPGDSPLDMGWRIIPVKLIKCGEG